MRNLLEDVFIIDNLQVLNEGNSSGPMRIRGIFQRADEENNNKRIYPKNLLERELKKLQVSVTERRLMGELDHPQHDSVKLNNVSHLITKLELKGRDVIGEAEILETPAGQVVKALIKGGVKVGISSRGLGTLSEGDDGKRYVNEDFNLITWDMVADPSTRGAYPDLTESTKINQIIEDVLPNATKVQNFKTVLRNKLLEYDPRQGSISKGKPKRAAKVKELGRMGSTKRSLVHHPATRKKLADKAGNRAGNRGVGGGDTLSKTEAMSSSRGNPVLKAKKGETQASRYAKFTGARIRREKRVADRVRDYNPKKSPLAKREAKEPYSRYGKPPQKTTSNFDVDNSTGLGTGKQHKKAMKSVSGDIAKAKAKGVTSQDASDIFKKYKAARNAARQKNEAYKWTSSKGTDVTDHMKKADKQSQKNQINSRDSLKRSDSQRSVAQRLAHKGQSSLATGIKGARKKAAGAEASKRLKDVRHRTSKGKEYYKKGYDVSRKLPESANLDLKGMEKSKQRGQLKSRSVRARFDTQKDVATTLAKKGKKSLGATAKSSRKRAAGKEAERRLTTRTKVGTRNKMSFDVSRKLPESFIRQVAEAVKKLRPSTAK